MSLMSNYPNGFANGITIRGNTILSSHSGRVFWVYNGTALEVGHRAGSNGNPGTYQAPFSTIDYAIGRCTANRGDIIIVKAGHAETITAAAGIDADVAGISIIGLGAGTDMPEITFTTSTGADVDINAANITIKGIRFICGINSQTAMIDVNSTDFTIEGCEFHESSATGLTAIDINGGASNACDRAKVLGCRFYLATAANWDRAIELGEVADGVEISDNIIIGDFDDAGIHNPSGKVLTNLLLARNYVRNNQAGQHAIELVSACTGAAYGNRLVTDASTTAFDAGALSAMDNLWNVTTGGDTEGQPVNPVVDVGTNFIGVNDSDNAAATTNVVANEDGSVLERLEQIQEAVNKGTGTAAASNKSVLDAIGFDGSASIAASAGMLRTMAGTTFVVKKTLTSSAVVQAGVDVTGVSSVGDICIEDWYLQTDATGLAAGTNFTLETNNTKGAAVFCSHAVASLGAQALVDKKTATTGKGTVLESGKKVVAKCTVADCTGSGTIDVYLICRRLADNATLAAA